MTVQLPPFPVDDSTLDLLSAALDPREHGDPEAEMSSVGPLLRMLGEMHGADYHDHDVLRALIAEVRGLRRDLATMTEVARGNKRHVAYLTEENDRLRGQSGLLLDGTPVQEWTWRHNRYVGVEQAVRDGVIRDREAAERSAATCRRANPGHDVGVVTRFVTPWVEVPAEGVSEGASV